MTKLLTTTALCLVFSLSSALAESKKIFAGTYLGNSAIENPVGDRIYYGPIRFKVAKSGTITGTAYNTRTSQLLNITGTIGKVTSQSGMYFTGKASGKFSDGTKWNVQIVALKGVSAKSLSGSCSKGTYRGSIQATKN